MFYIKEIEKFVFNILFYDTAHSGGEIVFLLSLRFEKSSLHFRTVVFLPNSFI